MLKKFRFKYLLILLPILGLLGFTGFKVYQAMKAKAALQGGTAGASGPGAGAAGGGGRGGGGGGRVQQVQTDTVTSGTISEQVALTGSLKPKNSVDVNPRIAGRLVRLTIDTGQAVARGALIATIEDDEINQQIERSKASISVVDATIGQREAEFRNAQVELERNQKLVAEGIISRTVLDALETRHQVAQSQLTLARAQRRQSEAELRELTIRQGQTRVFSPLSGVVAKRHVDVGAMLSSGTPIVTVVSLNPMVIEATASERDIARIRPGTTVKVTVDSLPNQQFTGRVLRISPLLDPSTRNGIVEIEIPNRNQMLKGEMFARIELNLGSKRETTLLPRDALVYRGDQPGVYTVEKDVAKFLPVETGLTQGDKVEVLQGLKVGDVIVTRGSNLIKDGDRVRTGGAPGGPGPKAAKDGPEAAGQPPSGPAPKSPAVAEQKPNKLPPPTPGAPSQPAR